MDPSGRVDHQAFLAATLPYMEVVYRVAQHQVADPGQAEDLVQDTYLRAFEGFARCEGTNVRAWLVAICMNTARSQARRRAQRPEERAVADLDSLAGSSPDTAERVLALLDGQEVHAALRRLPYEQRTCIVLMDLAGLTARETAALVGCPRGTVLARVHRGRRRLARLLVRTGTRDG